MSKCLLAFLFILNVFNDVFSSSFDVELIYKHKPISSIHFWPKRITDIVPLNRLEGTSKFYGSYVEL